MCRLSPRASLRGRIAGVPERESGRACYCHLCFKVFASVRAGAELEVGDGGFVGWAVRLLGSRKERLLISGFGSDRLAVLSERWRRAG